MGPAAGRPDHPAVRWSSARSSSSCAPPRCRASRWPSRLRADRSTAPAGAVLFGAAHGRRRHDRGGARGGRAQLLPSGRAASGLATALLLAGLLARMVGDGVPALAWLQWGTPFGLHRPHRAVRGGPLLPLMVLAGHRGGARRPGRRCSPQAGTSAAGGCGAGSGGTAPSRLLRSLPGLAVAPHPPRDAHLGAAACPRTSCSSACWRRAMLDFLQDNPVFAGWPRRPASPGSPRSEGYVSAIIVVSLLAVALGAFAAGRMAHAAGDETAGRLAPAVTRCRSPGRGGRRSRRAPSRSPASSCAGVAGLATWVGTTWVGAGLGVGEALAGAGERRPGRPAVSRCGARRARLGAAGGAGAGRAAGRRRLPAAGPGRDVPMAGLGARAVAVRPPLGGAGRAAGRRRGAGDARRRRPARRLGLVGYAAPRT